MIHLIKRLFQLIGYAFLPFFFLIGSGLLMQSDEAKIRSGFVIAIITLAIAGIIVWKKRKKLSKTKIINPFKSEVLEDGEPTSLLKKIILFPVYCGVGGLVMFGMVFVLIEIYVALLAAVKEGDYDTMSGVSLFTVGLYSGYIFLPILGIILEKLGKQHPHENFRKFIFAAVRSAYLTKHGVLLSIAIAGFLFFLEWLFDVIFVITKAEWFLFYVLILPTVVYAVLLTAATSLFYIIRLFNKNIKPLTEYLKISSKKAENDNWSRLATSLGYFGFSMFKIGSITFFLMCLFINHEFRIPAFVLCLLYLSPNFYIWFISARQKKPVNINKT